MSFFIGFGKFNKKYFYILFAVLSKLISQIVLGLGYSVLKPIAIFKNKIIQSPINYFTSFFLFSLIIGFIGLKSTDKEESDNDSSDIYSATTKAMIENFYSKNNRQITKDLIIIGLFFVYIEVHDQLFYSNNYGGLDYWMLEIIILSYFMRKYLKNKALLHQKLSLYICVLSSFIARLTSSFFVSKNIGSNENSQLVNIYEYIIYKTNHWIFIPILILLFQLMCIGRAFSNSKVKMLTDILYISPYKILFTYGIFGIIFCITYIPFSFLFDQKYLFLGNIFDSFKEENILLTIFYICIYGIFNSLRIFFDIIIIKELSPFFIFAKYKIYYLLIQIMLIFNGMTNKQFLEFYIIEVTSDIMCFFGFLIYLELIELRCKGLNYELKKNIINRSTKENNLEMYTEEDNNLKIFNDLDTSYSYYTESLNRSTKKLY